MSTLKRKTLIAAVAVGLCASTTPLAMSTVFATENVLEAYTFVDVNGHWAQSSIERMVQAKVINGVDAQHFAPEQQVTRAEFLKMLVLTMTDVRVHEQATFSDVKKGDWYFDYIETAVDLGIIKKGEVQFQPNSAMIRSEAALWMSRIMPPMNTGIAGGMPAPYQDVSGVSTEVRAGINLMYYLGIMTGETQVQFQPIGVVSRATAAVILERVLNRIATLTWGGEILFKNRVADDAELQAWVNSHTEQKGIFKLDHQGHTYILVTRGTKTTTGYDVQVTQVQSIDGKIVVSVSVNNPKPGEMQGQMITYPAALIMIPQTNNEVILDAAADAKL